MYQINLNWFKCLIPSNVYKMNVKCKGNDIKGDND